jgi:MFS family permease
LEAKNLAASHRREVTADNETPIRLGLRENLGQFSLLVLINFFVGRMVGLERTVVPLIGERDFGLASKTAIVSFIVAFGVTKAACNLLAGRISETWGRKRVLVFGWLMGLPVPIMIILGVGPAGLKPHPSEALNSVFHQPASLASFQFPLSSGKKRPALGKRALWKGETNSGYFFFLAFFFAGMVYLILLRKGLSSPRMATACGRARPLTQYVAVTPLVVKSLFKSEIRN